jgi:hypothetical protein
LLLVSYLGKRNDLEAMTGGDPLDELYLPLSLESEAFLHYSVANK